MSRLIVLAFLLVLPKIVDSCGCGLALPPPPCPPPMLPPPCPPTFCPPPPMPLPCPPPPPQFCPPPLPPPPPPPCGCGGGGYQPAPIMPSYAPPPAFNDCCCQCGNQCRYRGRARTHGSKIFSALSFDAEEDATCNSEKLRAVIEENITRDATISKRAIQKAAEEKLGGRINVICAKADFSYVAYTETYCQASSGDVTCYAFKPQ